MLFTKKLNIAVHALKFLESNLGEGPVSGSRIARTGGFSTLLTYQVLKDLVSTGMVESTRGPGGGYTLGVYFDINLADIVNLFSKQWSKGSQDEELRKEMLTLFSKYSIVRDRKVA